MSIFILFPNTLFENIHKLLKNHKKVYLLEDEIFFTRYKNNLKIAYLLSAINFYTLFYKEKYNIEITRIKNLKDINIKYQKVCYFNPTDHFLTDKLNKHFNDSIIQEYDTFLFVLNESEIMDKIFSSQHDFLNHFKKIYNWKFLDKSYDADNRLGYNDANSINSKNYPTIDKKYYILGISEAKSDYNISDIELPILQNYPVTFEDAKRNLDYFIDNKFNNFGTYQDAISKSDIYLYHSNISSSLNIGLITPEYVYKRIIKKVNNSRNKISINNIEGFLRQVLGWREYMRYIYVKYPNITKSNYWNAKRELVWKYWNGSENMGIDILDNEIKKTVKYSYSHHIVRLMVFLNIFVLLSVNPSDILRWFMTVCAIDAYHWCMIPNIYALGYFDIRFTRKPYISSSNYISKMSNYNRDETIDSLYYFFLSSNNKKKNLQFYKSSINYYTNLTNKEKLNIEKKANIFMKKVVR